MQNNETKTLWISVFAALFAVFLLYSWSQEKTAAMHKKFGSKVQVVVASKDIDEMQILDESFLEITDVPTDFKQPSALQNPELAIGQLALAPIKKGEQILNTKIIQPGKDTGLSMQVTPGKRATSISVDDLRGVSKLIKPGDRVDLLVAVDSGQGADKKREIITLMQDVTVLATGTNIVDTVPVQIEEDGKEGQYIVTNLRRMNAFSTITVEASPTEVQKLTYISATNPGSIFISLRNPNDRYINPLKTTDADDVLGKIKAPRLPAQEPVKPAPPPAPAPAPKKTGPYEEL